jgi:hypothetical protein
MWRMALRAPSATTSQSVFKRVDAVRRFNLERGAIAMRQQLKQPCS